MESEVIDKCRKAQTEGRAAASKDAWLPSLFNLKWMLSCLATRSVTLRYGGGGGWAQRHNAALCLHRTASCGMILAHMHSPPPSSAMDGGSLLWPHIFHFSTWKAPSVDLVVKSPFPLWHKKEFLLQQWTCAPHEETEDQSSATDGREDSHLLSKIT